MKTRALLLALLALAAAACKDSREAVEPPTALFVPAPAPAPPSITLQSGGADAEILTLNVVVTGVADFFQTAFTLDFDSGRMAYLDFADSTSFLREGGAETLFSYLPVLDPPSTDPKVPRMTHLLVTATRIQNETGTVTGVDATGPIVLLSLRFRVGTGPSATAIDFASTSREVRDHLDQLIAVNWAGGWVALN